MGHLLLRHPLSECTSYWGDPLSESNVDAGGLDYVVAETPADLVEHLEKLFTGDSPNRSAGAGIEDRIETGILGSFNHLVHGVSLCPVLDRASDAVGSAYQ